LLAAVAEERKEVAEEQDSINTLLQHQSLDHLHRLVLVEEDKELLDQEIQQRTMEQLVAPVSHHQLQRQLELSHLTNQMVQELTVVLDQVAQYLVHFLAVAEQVQMLLTHRQGEVDKENNLHQLMDQLTEAVAEVVAAFPANQRALVEMVAEVEQIHLVDQEVLHRQIMELEAAEAALAMDQVETAHQDMLLY
jgi:hypothetical protein